MEQNILVLTNTPYIVNNLSPLFLGEGLRLNQVKNMEQLLQQIKIQKVHLIMLDIKLDENGLNQGIRIIQYLRTQTPIPILVISAQEEMDVKIKTLNAGADDYMALYGNPLLLVAVVKSHLRRYLQLTNKKEMENQIYRVGDLEVNDRNKMVLVDGKEVKMTPIEYQILYLLMRERGKVFSISQIYEFIWKMQAIEVDNTIAVHICHIREKIEENPKKPCYLKVVRGMGYKVG